MTDLLKCVADYFIRETLPVVAQTPSTAVAPCCITKGFMGSESKTNGVSFFVQYHVYFIIK